MKPDLRPVAYHKRLWILLHADLQARAPSYFGQLIRLIVQNLKLIAKRQLLYGLSGVMSATVIKNP